MRKIKFKNSIFIKIFSICLICMVVPMLINLLYTINSSSNALESEASSSLSRIALEKNKQVNSVFNFQFSVSETMVNEPYMVDFFKEVSESNKIDRSKLNQITQSLGRDSLLLVVYMKIYFLLMMIKFWQME